MATTVAHSTVGSNSGGTSIALGFTPTTGNWLIVAISQNDSAIPTANTGWTRWGGKSAGGNLTLGVFYQQVGGSPSSTITPVSGSFSTPAPYAVWEVAGLPNGLPTDIFDAYMSDTNPSIKEFKSYKASMLLAAGMQRNATSVLSMGGTWDHTDVTSYNGSRDTASGYKALTANTAYDPSINFHGDVSTTIVLQLDSGTGTQPTGAAIRRGQFFVSAAPVDLLWTPTVGNWLVVAASTNDSTALAAATGWTRYAAINDGTNANMSGGIYYRQVQAGDTSSINPAAFSLANAVQVWEISTLPNGLPTDFASHYESNSATPSPGTFTSGLLLVSGMQRNATTAVAVAGGTYDYKSTTGLRGGTSGGRDMTMGDVALSGSFTPTVTYTGGSTPLTMAVNITSTVANTTATPGAGSVALSGKSIVSIATEPVGKGTLALTGFAPSSSTTPGVGFGTLTLTGKSITSVVTEAAGAGSLALTGYAPTVATPTYLSVGSGSVLLTGFAPMEQLEVLPGVSSLVITGHAPVGYASGFNRLSAFGLNALTQAATNGRLSAFGLGALSLSDPTLRLSAFGASVLAENHTRTRITQMGLLVLAKGATPPPTPAPLHLASAGRSKVVNLRMVNMYYEQTPDGPTPDARFGRPGMVTAAQRGGGPVTALFRWQGYQFMVSGDTVWRDNENIGTVFAGDDTRFATSDDEIVIVTGGRAYYVTTEDVVQIADTDLPDPVIDVILGANGRFIYLGADGRWYWSDVGDARTIDALSFATADQAPDNLMAGINVQDSFVMFGTDSAEWWYATGDDDAPFERSGGRKYDKGLAARQTLVKADNSGYFVGSDRIVYRMGADPIRVSTYDVEDKLRRVSDADLVNAWAFAVTFGGHTFYVLSLPGQSTWAFDISQNRWSEWRSFGHPNFRVRTADGPYLGDNYSGRVMSFDAAVFTDIDEPLERIIGTYLPVRSGNLKNWGLMLATIRGVGTLATTHPVVEMRFSDTEGHLWSSWMEAPLGSQGDYCTKAMWDQLGSVSAPGRLFEFRVTDPVEFTPYLVKFNEVRA